MTSGGERPSGPQHLLGPTPLQFTGASDGSLENDTMLMTSPVPGPIIDDPSTKLRLLVPHIALASFLVLLAVASFIHYHYSNKESKADSKFTEELRSTLRRPRAAQGFPSTLVHYFGLGALNSDGFNFAEYLNARNGRLCSVIDVGDKQQTVQREPWPTPPSSSSSSSRPTVAPSAAGGRRAFHGGGGGGVMPYGPGHYHFDEEFKDYNYVRRPEVTLSPMSLIDDRGSPDSMDHVPYRDAGSFQTTRSSSKSEIKGKRGKGMTYRVALNPGSMRPR